MSRSCKTCQHLKRSEIDRRLAEGEPTAQVARAYDLNSSSLHRHRTNCLKLAPSNEIKKEAARGSAAVALLPSKENLAAGYLNLDLSQNLQAILVRVPLPSHAEPSRWHNNIGLVLGGKDNHARKAARPDCQG